MLYTEFLKVGILGSSIPDIIPIGSGLFERTAGSGAGVGHHAFGPLKPKNANFEPFMLGSYIIRDHITKISPLDLNPWIWRTFGFNQSFVNNRRKAPKNKPPKFKEGS